MTSVIQHSTVVWSGPIFYGPADITVAEQKYAIKAFTRCEWEFNPFVEPAAVLAKLQGENPRALYGRNRRQNIRMIRTELQRVEAGHAQVIRYTRNRPTKLTHTEKLRAFELWRSRRFDPRASSAQKISDLLALEGITAKKSTVSKLILTFLQWSPPGSPVASPPPPALLVVPETPWPWYWVTAPGGRNPPGPMILGAPYPTPPFTGDYLTVPSFCSYGHPGFHDPFWFYIKGPIESPEPPAPKVKPVWAKLPTRFPRSKFRPGYAEVEILEFDATTPPPRSPTPPPTVQEAPKPPPKSKDPAFEPKTPIKGYLKRRPRSGRKSKTIARKKGYRDPETSDSDSEPTAIKRKLPAKSKPQPPPKKRRNNPRRKARPSKKDFDKQF